MIMIESLMRMILRIHNIVTTIMAEKNSNVNVTKVSMAKIAEINVHSIVKIMEFVKPI